MIEEVLGAPLRIRIILALWKTGEINATELAKMLETNYSQLIAHLQLLSKYGIVEERRIGRARLVRLRKTKLVEMLAKALEQVDEKLKAIYAAPQEKTS
jgi:DNA-binding transcriptional ArsR family regulator